MTENKVKKVKREEMMMIYPAGRCFHFLAGNFRLFQSIVLGRLSRLSLRASDENIHAKRNKNSPRFIGLMTALGRNC